MSADMISVLTLVRVGAGGVLVAIGVLGLLGGAIGILRLPDFYTRLHAFGAGDAVNGAILLLGLACTASDGAVALRLVALAILFAIAAPSLLYTGANVAHISGLAPLAGKSARARQGAP